MHRLENMHYHHVDCREDSGAALSKMVESDDDLGHYLKYAYVVEWCIMVKYGGEDTMLVLQDKLIQVVKCLHTFQCHSQETESRWWLWCLVKLHVWRKTEVSATVLLGVPKNVS